MIKDAKLKDKIEDPATHYANPDKVVKDKALSREDKKEALETWEQDERQRLTASNEGMPGNDEGVDKSDAPKLGQVERAKEKIGEKPKHKPAH
jgi:hypothetical protein